MEIDDMTAFNVVRFKVKPGREEEFVDAHRAPTPAFKGFISGGLIKTGDLTYCMVGEWRNFQSIVNARPQMIAMLDKVRDMLEDLGSGLGVTDPVSGDAVVKLAPAKKAARKTARKATKDRGASKAKPGAKSKGKSPKTVARKSAPAKRKR
jgi:hypothetical protein